MGQNDNARNIDLEWKNRVLCSDESCIGTIGADGRCRECGLKYQGELPDGIEDVSDDAISAPVDDDSDWADDDDDFASEEDGESAVMKAVSASSALMVSARNAVNPIRAVEYRNGALEPSSRRKQNSADPGPSLSSLHPS